MAENAPKPTDEAPPKKRPLGPGALILVVLILVVVAAFCFKDVVYPGTTAEEWRQEGHESYIPMNWAVMIAAVLGAVYAATLAVVRSRKPAPGAPPATDTPPKTDA